MKKYIIAVALSILLALSSCDWTNNNSNIPKTYDVIAPIKAQAGQTNRPSAYGELVGVWNGAEIGVTGGRWMIDFSGNYNAAIISPSGKWGDGAVMIRPDLGAKRDGVRVPKEWGLIDIEVRQSPSPANVGKIALGAFKRNQDDLKICLGVPGALNRIEEFKPSEGFVCLEMKRTIVTHPGEPKPRALGYSGKQETISVPNTMPIKVQSNMTLTAGKWYIVEASGVVSNWAGRKDGLDAVWCYAESLCEQGGEPWQQLRINDKGLSEIAGSSIAYNPNHVYAVRLLGEGKPVVIYASDAQDGGEGNFGAFTVAIRPDE